MPNFIQYSPKTEDKIYAATDCIIFGFDSVNLKLLVFKRNDMPLIGEWSLIGSFIKPNEDVSEAGKRVLKEITGLENIFMEELKVYSSIQRDPRFRCISIAQYALMSIDSVTDKVVHRHGAQWCNIDNIPNLVLDHMEMVKDGLERIKRKARYEPIGFELLPNRFTIPHLKRLYEAIYQKDIESSNFRKKIISLKLLVKLDEKDKSSSRRGAYLYKFDYETYQKLKTSGYNFELF
tara:strand:- start:32757 stop:33461 length:705 start_codon:yes stop_codon:yes gene_type:complete